MRNLKAAAILSALLCVSLLAGCGSKDSAATVPADYDMTYINTSLNMKNNTDLVWHYDSEEDVWYLDQITTVAYPENVDEQSISICIPESYVEGIDTSGDGIADTTTENISGSVTGQLVIRSGRVVTSTSGTEYHSGNAPIILQNFSQYGEACETQEASAQYAKEGYIVVNCGNRGTSPEGLADLKNDVLFLKYNIQLGNLPGSYQTITSNGGILALLLAATGHNEDFYSAQADAGAIGVFRWENGAYTFYTDEFPENMITDSIWGCVVTDTIGSLYPAELFDAMQRTIDPDFVYCSDFEESLDQALGQELVTYLNDLKLLYNEQESGLDMDGDGTLSDKLYLTIEKNSDKSVGLNGYFGCFLNYYLTLLNEKDNLPTDEQKTQAAAAIKRKATEAESSETSLEQTYADYGEMEEDYRTETENFYEDGIENLYHYNTFYYIGTDQTEEAKWVRFLDDPVTSQNSVYAAVALNCAFSAVGTNSDLRVVWDTDLSESELEQKYLPALVDELYNEIGIAANSEEDEDDDSTITMSTLTEDNTASGTGQTAANKTAEDTSGNFDTKISLAEITSLDSIHSETVPHYDKASGGTLRGIFTPESDDTHYDVFVSRIFGEKESDLEPLFKN